MLSSMLDENSSAFEPAYGRRTLAEAGGWSLAFHNGFELWWLAGMPLTVVFLLTLLSVSLASGGHKLRVSVTLALPRRVARWAASTVTGVAVRSKARARGSSGQLKGENLKVMARSLRLWI